MGLQREFQGVWEAKNIDFPKFHRNHYKNSSKVIFCRNLRFRGLKKHKTLIWLSKWVLIKLTQIRIFAINWYFRTHYRQMLRAKNIDFPEILKNHSKTSFKPIFRGNFRFWNLKNQKTSIWRSKWAQIALAIFFGHIKNFGFWQKKK